MDLISEALFGIHILFEHMFSLTSCSLTAPLIRELFQPLCCLQADNVLRSPFMILWIDAHALHKATKPRRHHEILKLRRGRSSTSTLLGGASSPRSFLTASIAATSTTIVPVKNIVAW